MLVAKAKRLTLLKCIFVTCLLITPITGIFTQVTQADNIQYVYDSLNRLVEVRYLDKVIHYTYDAAGNRTGQTVEILIAAPSILNLSPRGAVIGGNGFVLKINGANFTNNSVVQWNGANRPTIFVNAGELRINLASTDIAAVGTASVVVLNSAPNAVSNSQTFSVVQNAVLRGRVTFNGAALSNVTLNLNGAEAVTLTTDNNGNYEAAVLNNGNYTLTPTRQNYVFNPSNRNINYSGLSQTNLDFAASLVSYPINGRVTNNGNGLSGVTLSLTGSQTGQITTDNNGDYSFTATAEGNYLITPALSGYTFNPNSRSFVNLSADQTADFTATAAQTQHRLFDFDGDGKADISIFRPANGVWYLLNSQTGFTGSAFGFGTDKLVPADYDGDGKTDIAVYRNGTWYLLRSQLGFTGIAFGNADDTPVPADYDGDGKADIAVFRPSNGVWYLLQSQAGFAGVAFGFGTDSPVPADYDGDGKTDIAVFRNGTWYLQRSSQGFMGIAFGAADDKPIPNAFVP